MSSKLLLPLGLLFLAQISCRNETTSTEGTDLSQLYGRWELVEALRNDKPTETLAGAYMEFSADGALVTNLAGSRETVAYEWNDGVISQKEGRMPMDYTVEQLADSQLVLTMRMREFSFRLTLQKATETQEADALESDSLQ